MLPIEAAIVEELRGGPCSLDEVIIHLSSFGSKEIFIAMDRMVRDGRVLLRTRGYSAYQVSLGSHVADPVQHRVPKAEL
jgi:hypothetical protein